MGLLDGGGAALMSGVFSGVYLDAWLFRGALTGNGKGGMAVEFEDAEPVKAMRARTTETMRQRDGYVGTDMRILVLAHGVDDIDSECELEFLGKRWSIADVGRDPAGAYYDTHGRLVT